MRTKYQFVVKSMERPIYPSSCFILEPPLVTNTKRYDTLHNTLPLVQLKTIRQNDYVFSERELMFMFAICRRPSVCRLSSVTFVHPTQPIEIFGNVSAPCNTLVT